MAQLKIETPDGTLMQIQRSIHKYINHGIRNQQIRGMEKLFTLKALPDGFIFIY